MTTNIDSDRVSVQASLHHLKGKRVIEIVGMRDLGLPAKLGCERWTQHSFRESSQACKHGPPCCSSPQVPLTDACWAPTNPIPALPGLGRGETKLDILSRRQPQRRFLDDARDSGASGLRAIAGGEYGDVVENSQHHLGVTIVTALRDAFAARNRLTRRRTLFARTTRHDSRGRTVRRLMKEAKPPQPQTPSTSGTR